jgi:hypothetical protein
MCECREDFYTDAGVIPALPTNYPQSCPPEGFTNDACCAIFDPRPGPPAGLCRDRRGGDGRVESSGSADAGHMYKGPQTDPRLRDFYAQFSPELRWFAPCGR